MSVESFTDMSNRGIYYEIIHNRYEKPVER